MKLTISLTPADEARVTQALMGMSPEQMLTNYLQSLVRMHEQRVFRDSLLSTTAPVQPPNQTPIQPTITVS